MNKKQIRQSFRDTVFSRDNYKCVKCGESAVDAHHITDRNLMPSGGYVKENGISLCADCHIKAELYHTGVVLQNMQTPPHGYFPNDLYVLIGSSYAKAYETCLQLG